MAKILICGATSFVAKGLKEMLFHKGFNVDTFGRKNGSYLEIDKCKNLALEYDAVINFAVLKDQSTDNNERYIKALVKMCMERKVKKLIHFSSIMVYNYNLAIVDEKAPIETLDSTYKKGYGEFKIVADQYLLSHKDEFPFELILVRPGYVLADNRPCPFIKKLPFGFSIIKGNQKSKQPIVRREDIHLALLNILKTERNDLIYHFFPNDNMTKYKYAKATIGGIILIMPKFIFKSIPYSLSLINIIPKSLYSRFEGMYIESIFSSKQTEKTLNIKFRSI